jgi:elongation factor G
MQLRPPPPDYWPLTQEFWTSRGIDAATLAAASQLASQGLVHLEPHKARDGLLVICAMTPRELAASAAAVCTIDAPFRLDIPRVTHVGTPTCAGEAEHTMARQTGGVGEFARVKMVFEPMPPGSGFVFENQISGGAIPERFFPAIDNAVQPLNDCRQVFGFPVTDFRVRLVDGAHHDTDSTDLAFDIATSFAVRKAAERSRAMLLEPVMRVEIVAPEDCVGTVIDDLNARRGVIQEHEMQVEAMAVRALVPLASLLGWGPLLDHDAFLAEQTGGRASATVSFAGLTEIPMRTPDPPPAAAARQAG